MMKTATLTIHLPANYGNALQMLSLQRYLISQGHTSVVLSHWWMENKKEISAWNTYCKESLLNRLIFTLACLTWTFKFKAYRRESKLNKWLTKNIQWSKETGWGGTFPFKELSVDAIVVGSDQIWNSNCSFVKFFLLPDVHDNIRKIAYAASFNANAFPSEDIDFYQNALKRFHHVSVRESSSIALINRKLGLSPTLTCDPSLLHSKDEWRKILNLRNTTRPAYNMCYIVSPQGREYYNDILRIAKETKKRLHVFAFDCTEINIRNSNILKLTVQMLFVRLKLFFSGARLHLSADPTEFMQYISECDTLFTDSFHGLMFATIFEKKCNVVIGKHKDRQEMKAKLTDFINDYSDKSIISEKFSASAAKKISISPKLRILILNSKKWIAEALS